MNILVGLFSRTPKDPILKQNQEKFKEFKKLVKNKKYDQALRLGNDYLQKVPNHHDVLFMMGGIHYMKERYKTAVSYFDRALEIGSYDVDVLLLKAYSHQNLNEEKQAIHCCNKILEVDEKNKSVKELLKQLNP